MRRPASSSLFAALASLVALGLVCPACDERTPTPAGGTVTVSSTARAGIVTPEVDAAAVTPRDGCTRAGSLESIAADPTCVVDHVREDVMRDAPRRLALALEAEPPETTGGATSLLRLSLSNVAKTETLVVLEAIPVSAAPRADHTRIAGMPEVRGTATGLTVPLGIATLDARERGVDATPMTGGTPARSKLLVVHLRPGAKLTQAVSWWAIRIPAPAAIFKDDAGHVNVPKTLPVPLERGDYLVRMEVPLFGLSPAERTVTTRIHVDEAPRGVVHPH